MGALDEISRDSPNLRTFGPEGKPWRFFALGSGERGQRRNVDNVSEKEKSKEGGKEMEKRG